MTEQEHAVLIANRVLNRNFADPDDDLAILSRQFLRKLEREGGANAQARIFDGEIIIRLAVANLPAVVEGSWAGAIDRRYKVTNPEEFAADLVIELNRESETGTTEIHKMFDKVIEEAIDQGALGIEEHERQEA